MRRGGCMSKPRRKGHEKPVRGGQAFPLSHKQGKVPWVYGEFVEHKDVRVYDADGNLKKVVAGAEARKERCERWKKEDAAYKKKHSMVKMKEGVHGFFKRGKARREAGQVGVAEALENFEKASSKDFLKR
jgi:hypothetical protein